MLKIIKDYVINIIKSMVKDDFFGMASEMAFMSVIGVFPLLLFLMAVYGWLGKKSLINHILTFLHNVAPDAVVKLFQGVLKEVTIFQQGGLVAFIGFFVTLWLASNIITVCIKGLNRSFKVNETRFFLYTQFLSIVMVFVNAFALFISINLIIFGRVILETINEFVLIPPELYNSLLIGRWPVAFILLYLMALINYYILPCVNFSKHKKAILPGTMFFCVFWLAGSWFFSLYVNHLQTYNRVYGTIGAFAMLMVWLYFTSIIFLIGGQINSQTYDRLIKKSMDCA